MYTITNIRVEPWLIILYLIQNKWFSLSQYMLGVLHTYTVVHQFVYFIQPTITYQAGSRRHHQQHPGK